MELEINTKDDKFKTKKTQDIKQYLREYRQNNKDKIKEYYEHWISQPENNPLTKILCPDCGAKTVKSSISKHRKTMKCQKARDDKLKQSLE